MQMLIVSPSKAGKPSSQIGLLPYCALNDFVNICIMLLQFEIFRLHFSNDSRNCPFHNAAFFTQKRAEC